jgi:uncharacterized protein (DUF2062 family)
VITHGKIRSFMAVPHHQHGLHTPHALTRLGRIRLAIRRQSRSLYKSIRHPKNRKRSKVRAWLADKIRNRSLWQPTRKCVAAGLAGGLFFSMLPIPLQSVAATAVGMARGWNLPAAISATWLSNPFTYVPMLIGAKYSVIGFFAMFGQDCAAGRLSMDRLGEIWAAAMDLKFGNAWNMAGPALLEIALGMVLLGTVLAIIGWIAVQVTWMLLPKKSENPAQP